MPLFAFQAEKKILRKRLNYFTASLSSETTPIPCANVGVHLAIVYSHPFKLPMVVFILVLMRTVGWQILDGQTLTGQIQN